MGAIRLGGIGITDLDKALGQHTRRILLGNLAVYSTSTGVYDSFTAALANPANIPADISSTTFLTALTGAFVEFMSGTLTGTVREVTAISFGAGTGLVTVTVDKDLGWPTNTQPSKGDQIVIYEAPASSSGAQEVTDPAVEANTARLNPISKANVFNTAASANTDILATAITPTNSPSLLRVTIATDTAAKFTAQVTQGSTTVALAYNSDTALVAGAVYLFDIAWQTGDSVNFQVDTAGTIFRLSAMEVGAGT